MITVRVRVFGGVRLWRSGAEVDIGSARTRTVLAVLLAARGATVSTAELVDVLWGEQPSASAVNQVQRLIGQVRRLFEPELPNRETGSWLLPVGDGYRLRQDARTSDLMAFFEQAAARQFEQALTTSHDQPFAGLPAELLDLPTFRAIDVARVDVAVQAADLALEDPRAHRLLPQLTGFAQAAPFHEPLQARLIRLLTATGRRAEALNHFEEVRRRLADGLGADPGVELQAAHLDALSDPSQASQLPLRVAAFSPRDDLVAGLEAGRPAGVVVLSGMGGAGKTALAVDWAHRIAADYPDGQLYLDLRGFDPGGRQLRSAEALGTLLMTMGITPGRSEDPDALAAQFRGSVDGRRMIILLDNARDSAQVRPLLPGTPACLVVVTSRNRMPGLVARAGAWPVHVARLGRRAAKDLLTRRLGVARLLAEPSGADKLVDLCAGLPLALSIAAARIAVRPEESLTDVVAELESARRRLDVLDTGEEHDSVRSAFSWSYAVLAEPTARLFRLLAVHPGPDLSADTMDSIAGVDARAALSELIVATLVTPAGAGRYTVHDLLHEYATELLDGEPDERLAAERRMVEHYVHASRAAYRTFKLLLPMDPGPPPEGVLPPRFDDITAAQDWYDRERAVLPAVTGLALDRGWTRSAALIMVHVRPMRSNRLDSPGLVRRQGARAVDALVGLDEPELESLMLREAAVQCRAVDPDQARAYLLRALEIAQRRDDLTGQGQILRNLSRAPLSHGQEQLRYARRSVAIARQVGEPSVLGYALDALAGALAANGDTTGAAVVIDEAFTVAGAAGLTDLQVGAATHRAWIAVEAGDDRIAVRMAEWARDRALPSDEHTGYTTNVALMQAYHRLGDITRARTAAEQVRDHLVRDRPGHLDQFGPDEVARHEAQVDAILAGDGTAHGCQ